MNDRYVTVSKTGALLLSKIVNFSRPKVVSDAFSSKAVFLILNDCLLFLPFLLCLVLAFGCKVLVYISC